MSTKRSTWMVFSMRIHRFPLWVIFPLRCLAEVVEGFSDIMCLFSKVNKKAYIGLTAFGDALAMARNYGPLDVVDVDVASSREKVKIRLLLR